MSRTITRTLYTNAQITTLDTAMPEAEALVAEDGRILEIGGAERCRYAAGPRAEVIDLEGGFVYPGFGDGHVHLASYAREMAMVDLRKTTSYGEALQEVARFAEGCRPGQWILGGRWAQDQWSPGRPPHREQLDAVTGGRPAALASLDGHSVWANTAALTHLGIRRETTDPVGGRIVRDPDGEPTGVLQETAAEPARQLWSSQAAGDLRTLLRAAFDHALAGGITSIHDFDQVDAIDAYTGLRADDRLPLRVFKSVPAHHLETAITSGWRTGAGDSRLRQGPVKIFADGALGSRSAAMINGYRDDPANHGIVRTPPEEIESLVELAGAHGIAAAIHAIGDQANRTALSAFERFRAGHPGSGLRQRIEHAQHLSGEDLARFADLGVIASMQPSHCADDMTMAGQAVSPGTYSYPWRTLLDCGARLVFGSDAPVSALEPLAGIHAAVSRQNAAGLPPEGFQPEQRITVAEALHAYTAGPAWASGEEGVKGRLCIDMLADFVVLSDDLLRCEPSRIPHLRVHRTIVGGRVAWTS
jgi:predicted amidohydrolase YtcJ